MFRFAAIHGLLNEEQFQSRLFRFPGICDIVRIFFVCVRVVQIPETVTVSSDHDVVRKLGMGAVT